MHRDWNWGKKIYPREAPRRDEGEGGGSGVRIKGLKKRFLGMMERVVDWLCLLRPV